MEKQLLEKCLTKEELLRCEYNDQNMGFELDKVPLDNLIKVNMSYLPLEKSIKTECGLLTWTLNAGWIIVPEKEGEIQWLKFQTLADFLERNGKVIPFKKLLDESIEGLRIRMAREYLGELKQSLKCVDNLLNSNVECNIDLLVSLAKDFRTGQTTCLEDIRLEIEKEIQLVQRYIPNLPKEKLVFVPYAL